MNERIRELAEQASKDNSDGYPVTLEYSNRFAEKFAELIVRECIRIDSETGYVLGATETKTVGIKIAEHFGIKQ